MTYTTNTYLPLFRTMMNVTVGMIKQAALQTHVIWATLVTLDCYRIIAKKAVCIMESICTDR